MASGILVGFSERKFEVLALKIGVYSVAAIIRNCHDNFVWRLITVYGSPYDEGNKSSLMNLKNYLIIGMALL